jgi:hypothetical protein
MNLLFYLCKKMQVITMENYTFLGSLMCEHFKVSMGAWAGGGNHYGNFCNYRN